MCADSSAIIHHSHNALVLILADFIPSNRLAENIHHGHPGKYNDRRGFIDDHVLRLSETVPGAY
jgi:hypothetical protein